MAHPKGGVFVFFWEEGGATHVVGSRCKNILLRITELTVWNLEITAPMKIIGDNLHDLKMLGLMLGLLDQHLSNSSFTVKKYQAINQQKSCCSRSHRMYCATLKSGSPPCFYAKVRHYVQQAWQISHICNLSRKR